MYSALEGLEQQKENMRNTAVHIAQQGQRCLEPIKIVPIAGRFSIVRVVAIKAHAALGPAHRNTIAGHFLIIGMAACTLIPAANRSECCLSAKALSART